MVSNQPTILIVDDDEAICGLVSDGLTEDGYSCAIASDANKALIKLSNHHFDLALLDVKLPGKSGIELLRSCQPLIQNTKVIMITAVKEIDTAIQAMRLGASDYVIKPFTIDELSFSIRATLEKGKSADRSLSELDALAYGVEAQVDYFDFHSRIVTDRTIEMARSLGLPEEEIVRWANARDEYNSAKGIRIQSTLNSLAQNPAAQAMLGIYDHTSQYPEWTN